MRIAVIGGTASGPAAASEAVRVNPRAEVVLFEAGAHVTVGASRSRTSWRGGWGARPTWR